MNLPLRIRTVKPQNDLLTEGLLSNPSFDPKLAFRSLSAAVSLRAANFCDSAIHRGAHWWIDVAANGLGTLGSLNRNHTAGHSAGSFRNATAAGRISLNFAIRLDIGRRLSAVAGGGFAVSADDYTGG
jgi:hypothetical protein